MLTSSINLGGKTKGNSHNQEDLSTVVLSCTPEPHQLLKSAASTSAIHPSILSLPNHGLRDSERASKVIWVAFSLLSCQPLSPNNNVPSAYLRLCITQWLFSPDNSPGCFKMFSVLIFKSMWLQIRLPYTYWNFIVITWLDNSETAMLNIMKLYLLDHMIGHFW